MIFAIELVLGRSDLRAHRVTDPYSIHRVVYSLFEDVRQSKTSKCESSGFLYADMGLSYKGHKILILANRVPKEIELREGTMTVKEVPETFLNADVYRFKTVVNPTRRNNVSRKREPIVGYENVIRWFVEKAALWGFEVIGDLSVEKITAQQFKGKMDHQITINMATLSGVLRVTDRELFKKSFESGIGKERAFGCGLLQIVPIQ